MKLIFVLFFKLINIEVFLFQFHAVAGKAGGGFLPNSGGIAGTWYVAELNDAPGLITKANDNIKIDSH